MIRKALTISAAIAVALSSSAYAYQLSGSSYVVYHYDFYSDASHTNYVGSGQTICQKGGDPGLFQITNGSYGPYEVKTREGVCRRGIIIYE